MNPTETSARRFKINSLGNEKVKMKRQNVWPKYSMPGVDKKRTEENDG